MAVWCARPCSLFCSFSSAKAVQQALRLEELSSIASTSDSAATAAEGSGGEDGATDQEGDSR